MLVFWTISSLAFSIALAWCTNAATECRAGNRDQLVLSGFILVWKWKNQYFPPWNLRAYLAETRKAKKNMYPLSDNRHFDWLLTANQQNQVFPSHHYWDFPCSKCPVFIVAQRNKVQINLQQSKAAIISVFLHGSHFLCLVVLKNVTKFGTFLIFSLKFYRLLLAKLNVFNHFQWYWDMLTSLTPPDRF